MHSAIKFATAVGLILSAPIASALPVSAACTRLAFSVNDYGKDGPIKDAKQLLDKYIAQWTAERGIKTYRAGSKSVNCELFLDFVVFDEHTCKAEATVCWNEPAGIPPPSAAPAATPAPKRTAPNPAAAPKAAPAKPATNAPDPVPGTPKKPLEQPKAKAANVVQ